MTRLEELQELLLEMSNPMGYALMKIDELMPKTVLHLCKLACCLDENLESSNRKKWTHEVNTWLIKIDNLSDVKTSFGRLTYKNYVEKVQDRYTLKKIKKSIIELLTQGYTVRKDYSITVKSIDENFLNLVATSTKTFFEEQFKLLEEEEWDAGKGLEYIDNFIKSCYEGD